MIYDAFTFFNEFELLEVRLQELAGVVDRFVLVEATKTHSGKPKPLYYNESRSRFAEFADRIVHIVVDDLPTSSDAWILENFQRNAIVRGLANCRPDDVILVSDVDEIPRASVVAQTVRDLKYDDSPLANAIHAVWRSQFATTVCRRFVRKCHPFVCVFRQKMHNYFFNCVCVDAPCWNGTRLCHFRDFTKANEIRYTGYQFVEDAGWHFSYLGGVERIRQKIASFAHQEFNTPEYTDPQRIAERLRNGESLFDNAQKVQFVPLDTSYPRYLREHPERFPELIRPV